MITPSPILQTYAAPAIPHTPEASGAVTIVRRLREKGFTAYLAGGCVRDILLGRQPKDFDIATDAVPDRVLALFPGSVEVGKAFGVIRVPVADLWYEVATFRQDAAYRDGRHPDAVTFSDPANDALRRDFTINALFLDPEGGRILDYVEGMADIQRRVIRAVGNPLARFHEDHLRLLRAVRFAASLSFSLDPATAQAIRSTAASAANVSAERVREELTRIWLEAQQAGDSLVLLSDLGLLDVLLPEVAAMRGVNQPPEYHPEGDVFQHTVIMLNRMRTDDPRLAWSVLLHDVGKPPTARQKEGRWCFERHANVGSETAQRILERLRFSNDDTGAIAFIVGNHMRYAEVTRMRRSTLRQLAGEPTFPAELELHRLDCEASHGDLVNYRFLVEFRKALDSEPVLPSPWITGRDILSLGIPEGPEVGAWRKKAYEAQLEGTFPDRSALLEWLRREIPHSP